MAIKYSLKVPDTNIDTNMTEKLQQFVGVFLSCKSTVHLLFEWQTQSAFCSDNKRALTIVKTQVITLLRFILINQ